MPEWAESDAPIVVPWPEAPGVIARAAADLPHSPVLVGVTGPVGAGKSTLAAMLSACVLATDDFLPDHDRTDRLRADEPSAADLSGLYEALTALLAGESVRTPVWSFHEHRRVGSRPVRPAEIIVCEGIHAHEAPIVELVHLRVYVDAPREMRWRRWEEMALRGERGWDVALTREYFHAVAEPTFHRRAQELRAGAHVVVINS